MSNQTPAPVPAETLAKLDDAIENYATAYEAAASAGSHRAATWQEECAASRSELDAITDAMTRRLAHLEAENARLTADLDAARREAAGLRTFVQMVANEANWIEVRTEDGDPDYVFKHDTSPDFNGPLHERAQRLLRDDATVPDAGGKAVGQ